MSSTALSSWNVPPKYRPFKLIAVQHNPVSLSFALIDITFMVCLSPVKGVVLVNAGNKTGFSQPGYSCILSPACGRHFSQPSYLQILALLFYNLLF